MSTLLKQKVRLVITEVNRARRRVVGSISRVLRAERAAAAEKVGLRSRTASAIPAP